MKEQIPYINCIRIEENGDCYPAHLNEVSTPLIPTLDRGEYRKIKLQLFSLLNTGSRILNILVYWILAKITMQKINTIMTN